MNFQHQQANEVIIMKWYDGMVMKNICRQGNKWQFDPGYQGKNFFPLMCMFCDH